jgi:hypothetical protein
MVTDVRVCLSKESCLEKSEWISIVILPDTAERRAFKASLVWLTAQVDRDSL